LPAGPSAVGPSAASPTGAIPPAAGLPAQAAEPSPAPIIDAGYGAAGPDDETAPMPVILRGREQADPQSAGHELSAEPGTRVRGPFEPLGRTAASPHSGASVWSPTSSTMDQIKDLYLTAEAIGEDALDKHFQLVSDKQRQLIKDYFNQAGTGRADGHGQ